MAIACKNKDLVYNDPIPKFDSFSIPSKFLNEDRVINVWVPENYLQSTENIPVLYMADGGIKEDFPHIANTMAKLMKENKIPPYILVGIENTDRRKDLTGPSKIEYDLKYISNPRGADNFRTFIREELFPEIDKKYRTENKKAIIGESLAGLFVIETFLLENEMFDFYIAMDPSLWFNEQYLLKNFGTLAKENYQWKKKLWFSGSSAADISIHTKDLEGKLKQSMRDLIWTYSDEPKEKHNTIFRATKEKALIWTLNENNY